MEIPLNAQVECTDGIDGRSEYVLIDPISDQVTHLVVREDSSPNTEYIVPVDFVTETIAETIRLSCSKAEMEKLELFVQTEYIQEKVPDFSENSHGIYGIGSFFYKPYATPDVTVYEIENNKQIPPGELAAHRGTHVEATDGYVGTVDEFVVNPSNGHISHMVMREGHLWGAKDVIIPLSEINETHKDTVFLKLDKHQIESLPAFPLKRRWS